LTGAGVRLADPHRSGAAAGTRTDPLARSIFAALVVAALAAFFVTQRLKHTPTAVQQIQLTPYFSPVPAGHVKEESISFKIAQADEVTVEVVDGAGAVVATLVRDHPVARYKRFSLRWNGRTGTASGSRTGHTTAGNPFLIPENEGAVAPTGQYRVRVHLHAQNRSVTSTRSFTLVSG
jgi:hypothetical protein